MADVCMIIWIEFLKLKVRDFPCGPVVKTLPSNAGDVSSDPGQEAKIPHELWPQDQNKKHQYS